MIEREELVEIGQFKKTHGVKGELLFSFTNDSFDNTERPFLVCEMDGIFVPFLIEEYRFNSESTSYVKLKRMDSEIQAKRLTGKTVYFPKKDLKQMSEQSELMYDYFLSYRLLDKNIGDVGVITRVDDSTLNVLFVVEKNAKERLIPVTEDFILNIDHKNKVIYSLLPEGIADI